MDNLLLKANSLTKEYAPGKGAIDINLEVGPGEIVGFIGPNGAGKTTTMRMLMGFITPQSGTFELLGHCVNSNEDLVPLFNYISFLPSDPQFYPDFTPKQLFKYSCGVIGKNNMDKAVELSRLFDLDINTKFKNLSQGNKTKVGVVNALFHEPKLVVLDEPTSGLDPLIQQKVLGELEKVRERGDSVFLSSHVLSEVEQITDRIYMIKDAQITLEDSTKAILDKALKKFELIDPPKSLAEKVEKMDEVKKSRTLDGRTFIYVEDTQPVLELLNTEKFYNFFLQRTSLEEMFLDKYEINND